MNSDRNKASKRRFLKLAGAALVSLPMINFGSYRVFAGSEKRYDVRVIDTVNSSQVIDMLSIMSSMATMTKAMVSEQPKRMDSLVISEKHLKLILSSGIDVFHPAMGMGADGAFPFIGRLNALMADHPEHISRIDSVDDFEKLKKGHHVGFIIGIQNSDHFREVDDVDLYYHAGQRVSQLTYNSRNLIGTGSTDRADGGLSDFGVAIVERMNEVGMVVDVSHCGDKTTLDAITLSKKPVLITHSNVRTLVDGHVRCKSDEAIKAMAQSEGVMGITGIRNFVRSKDPTTVEHIVDHIEYVANLVGIDHVGIGSDMNLVGFDNLPESAQNVLRTPYKSSYGFRKKIDTDGYDHPMRVYDLTQSLFNRGFSEGNIRLILGQNFKRSLGKIWVS